MVVLNQSPSIRISKALLSIGSDPHGHKFASGNDPKVTKAISNASKSEFLIHSATRMVEYGFGSAEKLGMDSSWTRVIVNCRLTFRATKLARVTIPKDQKERLDGSAGWGSANFIDLCP